MKRFTIRFADITAEIHCRYALTEQLCSKFIVSDAAPDIVIEPKEADLAVFASRDLSKSAEYIEFIAIGYMLSEEVLKLDAALIHAAAISVDGEGFAFSAPSGTGKTTHIRQWRKLFGKRCRAVNGDKPIVTFRENGAFICGTPWCGKERYTNNITVPLRAICFIERDKTNSIKKIDGKDITDRLFHQLLLPNAGSPAMALYLTLADRLINTVPFYLLKCNISTEAAEIAYEAMSKDR